MVFDFFLALAVGVGVGVGLNRGRSDKSSPTAAAVGTSKCASYRSDEKKFYSVC